MVRLINLNKDNSIKIHFISKELIIDYETAHYLNTGQYLNDELYIENNICKWSKGLFGYLIDWCKENYPDTQLLYSWVFITVSAEFIVNWYFKLPSYEAKIHYQLSDIPMGGDWF